MNLVSLNRKKRVRVSDLNTRVIFYEYVPKKGPYPGEEEKRPLYSCWAKIDHVWMKDLETAKHNNTLSDVTLTIRDAKGDYFPSNKHFLEINSRKYKGNVYNVRSVQPDLQNNDFITVVAQLKGAKSE